MTEPASRERSHHTPAPAPALVDLILRTWEEHRIAGYDGLTSVCVCGSYDDDHAIKVALSALSTEGYLREPDPEERTEWAWDCQGLTSDVSGPCLHEVSSEERAWKLRDRAGSGRVLRRVVGSWLPVSDTEGGGADG